MSPSTPRLPAALLLIFGFAAMIFLPLAGQLAGHLPEVPLDEYRTLAAAPARPRTLKAAMRYPAALTAFLDDHYGFRDELVRQEYELRFDLFGEFVSDQVILGRHDRLFLTSHVAGLPFSLIDRICGTTADPAEVDMAAHGMADLLTQAAAITPDVAYLSIPTSPIIDGGDLPPWLAQRCATTEPFVPRLARAFAALRPDLATRLVYPRQVLLDAKAHGAPYPLWNFHWSGLGARAVVEATSEQLLHEPKRVPLPDRTLLMPSDIGQFTPGIEHVEPEQLPDHAAAGITFCEGAGGTCDPVFRPFARQINEISESHWQSGHGPSLLILSDSFGRMAAQYFSEYFADVLNLNLAYDQFTPGEYAALVDRIAARGRPDVLLIIFHDAAASDVAGLAGRIGEMARLFHPIH